MYLNGSLNSLNNSLNNSNLIELDGDDNLALSTTTSIQTNIISSNTLQSSGSNSNLSKFNLIQNTTLLQQQQQQQQIPCKLCGTQTASMRCAECMNMQLCYSCDSSFHQHPKRRTHKRKSINSLNTTTNYFSNDDTNMLRHSSSSSINNLPNQQIMLQSSEQKNAPFKQIRGLEHSNSMSSFANNKNFSPISSAALANAHPTNMPPLPPPRRKKSRNPNESIIMNNFRGLPGVDQRAYGNNPLSSSCGNLTQLNRQSPMHFKLNNQFNNNNSFGNYSNNQPMNRRQSVADSWQASKQANLMPQNYVPISPQPFNNLHNIRNLQQLQNLQNLQNQQTKLLNPYQLQRQNLSLTDINSKNVQLLANAGLNPILPYSFDMNSISQSMDDLMVDDESFSDDDNYSSNSSRKHRQFSKKNNSNKQVKRSSSRGSSLNDNQNLLNKKLIRRSQSSALINSMPLNPYDFDSLQQNQLLANLYYAQPLLNAGISPANSIRSLEPVKRKSSVSSMMSNRTLVNNNELYNDVDRSRNSRYRRTNEKQARGRSKSLCRSKSQSSNRSGRSFKPTYDKLSTRMSSDSEEANDKESECSMESTSNYSNLDESTQSEFEDKSKANKKKWKCNFCTFVNRIQMNICEICAKSNPQVLKQDNLCNSNKKAVLNNIKQTNRSRSKTRNETNKDDNQKRSSYIEFTDELIKQQAEVEKELLRRLANEKLVEEENLKLEKEQQKLTNNKLNDKSRTTINSNQNETSVLKNESKTTNLNDETNDLINKAAKTNNPTSPAANNVKNIVSKIKPPSISLKQQTTAFNKVGTNKLVKNHSLDSSTYQGRQREEHLKAKQSSFGKSTNVQQPSHFKSAKPEEQKITNDHLVDQPVKESSSSSYDMMEMFKLLKEAEKKDYLAEELEIALSFNSIEPIAWLDNNWPSMKETVLTLANNQLLTICQESNSGFLTVNEEDARSALRFTKGNIWQAVDRCISLKKEEIKEMQAKKQVYSDKYDVKSFTFNLKSLGQGNPNRDGNKFSNPAANTIKCPSIQISQPVQLSNSQINKMESLLNGWYETNLKVQNQASSNEAKPKTSDKVKNLIVFLKKNGFFDTNQLSQEEIDNQMKILMNLLEQKLKETQETNQSNSLNNSNNSSRSSTSFKSSNSINSSNLNRSNNSNLIDLSSSNNQSELSKIDREFEEIDEKMKQSLNCLKEIEQEAKKKSDENLDKKSPDLTTQTKRTNFKNLKITSEVFVSDDKLENDFQDASDKLNVESVHNVNIKLDTPVEGKWIHNTTANFNLKKEKGKIKIIKRKIYRNNSSEQKCIEKVAYVNDIKEADLINLDDEINLSLPNDKGAQDEKESNQDQPMKEPVQNEPQKNNEQSPLLIDDDVEKQLNQLNPNFQFARTYYDCELCASKHHINELVSMLFCTHRACKSCLVKYFTIQIREKQRVVIKCPFCDQPDIQADDENAVHEYLSLLQELVKNIVSKDLYELFQRKVRDRALQKDPSFKWCLKCCSGFVAANVEGPILRCPDCKSLSCSKCGELWKEEHRILTCEQFKQWMLNGDEFMAEHKLTMHLDAFGIRCPKCKFNFELSKGGCLHFTCSQCGFEFCYGCDSEFTQKCSNSKFCEKLGLHCHHPRNCLYYLRDKKIEDLEKLLKLNNIDYEIKNYDKDKTECDVMEQKEIDDGFKDEPCKRKVYENGVCSLHYVEHLAKLIKCNHIDPIAIFDENELANVLRRELIDVPKRIDYTSKTYRTKLIETIEKHLPM